MLEDYPFHKRHYLLCGQIQVFQKILMQKLMFNREWYVSTSHHGMAQTTLTVSVCMLQQHSCIMQCTGFIDQVYRKPKTRKNKCTNGRSALGVVGKTIFKIMEWLTSLVYTNHCSHSLLCYCYDWNKETNILIIKLYFYLTGKRLTELKIDIKSCAFMI